MGLEAPRLDDRSYQDLVEEALRRIPVYAPEWTDHNPSDPGIALLELFAWMTDIVLYRLNRVPDRHFIKFMELIGMKLAEAEPASSPVTFWFSSPQQKVVTLNAGTTVSTTRTETEPAINFTIDIPVDVQVPSLIQVMTSQAAANLQREYQEYRADLVVLGGQTIPLFTTPDQNRPPRPDDAIYLGFDNNLSDHVLGLRVQVSTDALSGLGVNPRKPPFVWETLSSEEEDWLETEVDLDETEGFTKDGLIRLHLPEMWRAVRNGHSAYWIRCRIEKPEVRSTSAYTTSPVIKRVQPESWGITARAHNVTQITGEILGRSDGTPGQRFYLEHIPVVPRKPGEYLTIRYDNGQEERWTEVSDFASSGPDDRHYTLDSRTGELQLAPALPQRDGSIRRYGALIPKNALLVMSGYRFGGGQAGNVAARSINVLKTSLPYISKVLNRSAAHGGADAEDLEDCKLRVPGYLRTLRRAVTAADFEYLAREAAAGTVARAHCMPASSTSVGEVTVLIIPRVPNLREVISPDSLLIPDDVRRHITAYLDERRLIATRLTVTTPDYTWVDTGVRIRLSRDADPAQVRRLVRSELYRYLNPLEGGTHGTGWEVGRGLSKNDLIALLMSVPGVDRITGVKLYRVSTRGGDFAQSEEVESLEIPANGMLVSHEHRVEVE